LIFRPKALDDRRCTWAQTQLQKLEANPRYACVFLTPCPTVYNQDTDRHSHTAMSLSKNWLANDEELPMSNPKDLNETDGEGFCPERFRKSWSQAMAGETLPLSQLWEDVPSISDEEQAEIDAQFGRPDDAAGEAWIDMTEWVKHGGELPQFPSSSPSSDNSADR
jgi:hypothetical protein